MGNSELGTLEKGLPRARAQTRPLRATVLAKLLCTQFVHMEIKGNSGQLFCY